MKLKGDLFIRSFSSDAFERPIGRSARDMPPVNSAKVTLSRFHIRGTVKHTDVTGLLRRVQDVMTRDEKLRVLLNLSMKATQHGVMLCGPTENGYYWSCENHDLARHLLRRLRNGIQAQGIDLNSFPYRFHPENGPMLIIEPLEDD